MDVYQTLYPFYAPKIMAYVYGSRKKGWEGQDPLDFKICNFPIRLHFCTKVDF